MRTVATIEIRLDFVWAYIFFTYIIFRISILLPAVCLCVWCVCVCACVCVSLAPSVRLYECVSETYIFMISVCVKQ